MIKRSATLSVLKGMFPIPDFDESNIKHWDLLHRMSIQPIIASGGILPATPPFEKHPYVKDLIPDEEISGLMIGTFPPISYLYPKHKLKNLSFNGRRIDTPDMDYFHGNYSSLWKFTPIGFQTIKNSPKAIQAGLIETALRKAGVTYSDIVRYTQRSLNKKGMYDASDTNLNSMILNENLIEYLLDSKRINRIYFTNACFFTQSSDLYDTTGKLRLGKNDAFSLFAKTALDIGLKLEYRIPSSINTWNDINEKPKTQSIRRHVNDELKNKVVLDLRLTSGNSSREFKVCSAVSPAAVNRGKAAKNECIIRYKNQNGLKGAEAANQFLGTVLNHFFTDRVALLAKYNL